MSPDALIAIQTGSASFGDIAVMRVDGIQVQQLTAYGYNRDPRLSPDRQRIAYRSVPASIVSSPDVDKRLRQGNYNIWVITVDGGQAWKLTDSEQPRSIPDWSPDSRKVLFSEGEDGLLVEVEVDSQARREIGHKAFSPQYRPDGYSVGFITERGGLAWMDNDGIQHTLVPTVTLPLSTTVSEFVWLPGQHMVYTLMNQSARQKPTTIGIHYSTWIIQIDELIPRKVADGIHDLQISPHGQFVSAFLGTGWYDACMYDLQTVFMRLVLDPPLAQVDNVEQFAGLPSEEPEGFYPLKDVTWISDHLALGAFSSLCIGDPLRVGDYLIDPIARRMVQITRN